MCSRHCTSWRQPSSGAPLIRNVVCGTTQGGLAYESFLKETFLADRTTTIEQHLLEYPEVMTTLPPPSVANRYTG